MSKFIPLSVPNLCGREEEYVVKAVRDNWVSTGGAMIDEFEKNIASYVGVNKAVACQSGTAGLHLSLVACGVKAGEEVIVPALTFIAAVNPVKYVFAHPVFMDCDDDLCMDADKLKEFCENECTFDGKNLVNKKSGRKVSAIVVVHVFGNMANIEKIISIAKKYGLKVIEDATEALGTYDSEKNYAGTFGDVGVYSFNGNKIITTGGGGMVVSKNEEILSYIKYLSTQAKDDTLYFIHGDLGYNYRMTNVQAAMGLGQLEQLEKFIEIKKNNYFVYKELLCGKRGLKILDFKKNIRPNYWFYSLYLKDSDIKRDDLIHYLEEKRIQSRPIWGLIPDQKPYAGSESYKLEKSRDYIENIVNIPCSSNLTKEDAEYVAKTILEF